MYIPSTPLILFVIDPKCPFVLKKMKDAKYMYFLGKEKETITS
jgi:hypothetical protein